MEQNFTQTPKTTHTYIYIYIFITYFGDFQGEVHINPISLKIENNLFKGYLFNVHYMNIPFR
jgi:hypothetical protein